MKLSEVIVPYTNLVFNPQETILLQQGSKELQTNLLEKGRRLSFTKPENEQDQEEAYLILPTNTFIDIFSSVATPCDKNILKSALTHKVQTNSVKWQVGLYRDNLNDLAKTGDSHIAVRLYTHRRNILFSLKTAFTVAELPENMHPEGLRTKRQLQRYIPVIAHLDKKALKLGIPFWEHV
jgi:hypothetical protein